jgi:hypothetical protein
MADTAVAPSSRMSHALAALAAIGAVLLVAAGALWAYHGTAVFFDMLAAGIAYCF